jgi:hypothetical protein
MMVSNLDLSTLISQLPEAQRIQMAQLGHPEAQQALARELLLRRRDSKRVNKTQKSEGGGQVRAEAENEQFLSGEQRSEKNQGAEPEQNQGTLINTTV